jgi:ribonuclease Z
MGRRTDQLKVCGLTLAGISLGGVQTCLMVPELDLMFDIGAFVRGALRYRTILVTHGHQDHLGTLPYLVSQRHLIRVAPPIVHVPREILEPLRTVFAAWSEIEDFKLEVELHPRDPGDRVQVRKDLLATCLRAEHRTPSLAWVVERVTHRLLPRFRGLPGREIAEMRRRGESMTERHVTPLLGYTGDTRIELFLREPLLRRCRVLVHEVTSWDDRRGVEEIREWGHTHVDEMAEHAGAFEGEALVLMHRSQRHSRQQAQQIVSDRFPASVRDRVHVFGG